MANEQPGEDAVAAEPSTVDAPVRWSGSAAVPETVRKRPWWARHGAERPAAEPDDRAMTPPVDPWEGQDTPWDPMPLPPEVLPPTRVEPPPVAARPAVPYPPPPPHSQRRARQPVAPRQPYQGPPHQGPPHQGPPHQGPPHQRPLPPPPPRRRRRWPRRLAIVTLLGTLCCCGVPALLLLPAAGQYPVTAVLPASVGDLDLRDDAASRRAAERLSRAVNGADAFAGIYSDGNGKRVTVFGTTGLRLAPEDDVEAQITRLTPDYDLRNVQTFDLGVAGVHERCGVGRAGGATVVVCAWADHGSLATVLLTRRSVADSAELTGRLRSAILIRG